MTCKIRSGWNDEMRDPVTIARQCEDAGARVLTLHPRTRTQMYTGSARWDEIAAVVERHDRVGYSPRAKTTTPRSGSVPRRCR